MDTACSHRDRCHFYRAGDTTLLHRLYSIKYCEEDPAACRILWLVQDGEEVPADMWPDGQLRDAEGDVLPPVSPRVDSLD